MRITVHRGTDQIGGCVTEYESNGWKLFVDYGEQLPGAPMADKELEIDGLTHGDLSKSALLITHYHGDHIGKIAELPSELPIFMGQISKEIAQELSEHLSPISEEQRSLVERLDSVKTFVLGEQFSFGEFKIMPIVIDHSAFDAYAFRIEAKNLTVFHTGDFRTHGFRSGKLPQVIEKYVGKVDYVVCEATNVNRLETTIKSEHDLQKEFETAFLNSRYNVVYLSSTNIDRLFGLYHAAVRAHLPFYVDAYQKRMMDIVAGRDRIWGKSHLYKYVEGREPIVLHRDGVNFRINDKFKDFLAEHGYVLIARANDRFDRLLSEMPGDKRTFLSMWEGYLNSSYAAYSPRLAQYVGTGYEYLHTSGHCHMASLKGLLDMLQPKAIIPIHTDNPRHFADLFCDKWPVILLEDGESFAAICDPGFDTTSAKVIAFQEPDNSCEVIENPENLQWWMVDDKFLGEFQWWDDADSALHHVVYAPKRLLGYAIESDEDMAPFLYVVYNPDFTEHYRYDEGGHNPEDEDYQSDCEYASGQRVLANINDVLVPCEVVGPLTVDFLRKEYIDEFGALKEDDFQEYKSELWDWDWDKVVVRPLVKINTEYGEISSETAVQRIYIFPYIVRT